MKYSLCRTSNADIRDAVDRIEERLGIKLEATTIEGLDDDFMNFISVLIRLIEQENTTVRKFTELNGSSEDDCVQESFNEVHNIIEAFRLSLRISLGNTLHKRVEICGHKIKVIASNIRKPDIDWSQCSLSDSGVGVEGDIVLAEVTEDTGSTVRIEDIHGRDERIYTGDKVLVVLGNRHTGTSEYGEIPPDGLNIEETNSVDLLCHGGIVGTALCVPRYKGTHATQLCIRGILQHEGKNLNLCDLYPEWDVALQKSAPVIANCGTGAEIGKTTTAAALIRSFKQQGLRVAAAKMAGTGRYRDLLTLRDAGADIFMDFADVGLPSTYTDEDRYINAIITLINRLNQHNPDVIVAEFGGDIIEANIPAFFRNDALRKLITAVVHSSGDIMGMRSSLDYYKTWEVEAPIYLTQPKHRNNHGSAIRTKREVGDLPIFDVMNPDEVQATTQSLTREIEKSRENDPQQVLEEHVQFSDIVDTAEVVRKKLQSEGIVLVKNFPISRHTLFVFAQQFGKPTLKHSAKGTTIADHIGDVRVRQPEFQKLPTQTSLRLPFHTAHAYSVERPRYFAMLMADAGWRDQEEGMNGESLLLRWDDVINEFKESSPGTSSQELELLSSIPVCYGPEYVHKELADEPLITFTEDGQYQVRYGNDTLDTIMQRMAEGHMPDNQEYLAALQRFDATIRNSSTVKQLPLEKGDMLFIDNRFVAHARCAFREHSVSDKGDIILNPRQVLSVHVLAE